MFADGNCLFTYGSLYVLIDCRSYIYGRGSGLQMLLNSVVPSATQEFASYYEKHESAELKLLERSTNFSKTQTDNTNSLKNKLA